MSGQQVLDLGTVVVRCFFWCGHTVEGRPTEAHAAMERHYEQDHARTLDRIAP